jgi:hypothetical protein
MRTHREGAYSAKCERTTDNCNSFSFQNFTFQIESKKPIVKKKIVFVVSEKLGFRAFYDKVYSQWGLLPRSLLRLNYGNA